MSNDQAARGYYWERHTDGGGSWKAPQGPPPGHELAALRRGLGREAGDVPAMWSFYTKLRRDGGRSRMLRAEHAALTLFAVHQQSKRQPVHKHGIGLGTAMRTLRGSGKFSAEAVDRRLKAAATATSFAEITAHLRGLISQLRSVERGYLDYSQLVWDLHDWQDPDRVPAVRLRWGSQYFVPARGDETSRDADAGTATPPSPPVGTPEPAA